MQTIDISPQVTKIKHDAHVSQRGFSLFEAMIAALILAVAVAGVMRLHKQNIQNTAANFELQRAYWILTNAQQRYQVGNELNAQDLTELNEQLTTAGLRNASITSAISTSRMYSSFVQTAQVTLSWNAWSSEAQVARDGCSPAQGADSCITVRVQ